MGKGTSKGRGNEPWCWAVAVLYCCTADKHLEWRASAVGGAKAMVVLGSNSGLLKYNSVGGAGSGAMTHQFICDQRSL